MKLNEEQRARIEIGRAMVHVTEKGAEFYIEDVFDAYGEPSKGYKGKVYAFTEEGDLVGGPEPFDSLDECKAALEAL